MKTQIVELNVADPCAACGVLRTGRADLWRRVMRAVVPARCADQPRCRSEIEGLLRAELKRLDAE